MVRRFFLLKGCEKYEYQGETYQDINIYYKFVGTVEFNSELNIGKAG